MFGKLLSSKCDVRSNRMVEEKQHTRTRYLQTSTNRWSWEVRRLTCAVSTKSTNYEIGILVLELGRHQEVLASE